MAAHPAVSMEVDEGAPAGGATAATAAGAGTIAEGAGSMESKATGKAETGEGEGLSRELVELLEEKKRSTMNLIVRVRNTLNGLDQYSLQLAKMKEEHMLLQTQLLDMEAYNREMIAQLQAEQDRLDDIQGEIDANMPSEEPDDDDVRQV